MAANSRFAVATHLIIALAFAERSAGSGEPISSETLAHSVNTSPVVVRRLLGALQDAGLVTGHAGRHGGASLARSPKKISLRDIHRAVDASNVFGFSRSPPNGACPVGSCVNALLGQVFEGVQSAIDSELGKIRISDLVDKAMKSWKFTHNKGSVPHV